LRERSVLGVVIDDEDSAIRHLLTQFTPTPR
jgi:hypothetical protein